MRRGDPQGDPRWREPPADAADKLIRDVLGYLDAHPGASQRSIEEGLKEHRRADVRAAIKEGARQGLIRTAPGPRNSTLHWVDDPDVQALSTTELKRLMDGALNWLPDRMPTRQAIYRAA